MATNKEVSFKESNLKKQNKKTKNSLSSLNLFDRRIIYIDGEITDALARDVTDKLLRLDMHEKKDINEVSYKWKIT